MPIRSADRMRFLSALFCTNIYPVLVDGQVGVSDRHGVCPYVRPNGRIGICWVEQTYPRGILLSLYNDFGALI